MVRVDIAFSCMKRWGEEKVCSHEVEGEVKMSAPDAEVSYAAPADPCMLAVLTGMMTGPSRDGHGDWISACRQGGAFLQYSTMVQIGDRIAGWELRKPWFQIWFTACTGGLQDFCQRACRDAWLGLFLGITSYLQYCTTESAAAKRTRRGISGDRSLAAVDPASQDSSNH